MPVGGIRGMMGPDQTTLTARRREDARGAAQWGYTNDICLARDSEVDSESDLDSTANLNICRLGARRTVTSC